MEQPFPDGKAEEKNTAQQHLLMGKWDPTMCPEGEKNPQTQHLFPDLMTTKG